MEKIVFLIIVTFFSTIGRGQIASSYGDEDIKYEIELVNSIMSHSEFSYLKGFQDISYHIKSVGSIKHSPLALLSYCHESLHGIDIYTSRTVFENRCFSYRISADSSLVLKKFSAVIPSESILSYLPDYLKTNDFTKIYILQKDASSNKDGIYGLLEEYLAYSHEPYIYLKLYPFFDTCRYVNKVDFWNEFVNIKERMKIDFFTFRTYIDTYLDYLKKNDIEFYRYLNSDMIFGKLLTAIDNVYLSSLKKLDSIELVINVKHLNKKFKNLDLYNSSRGELKNFEKRYPDYFHILYDLNKSSRVKQP